MGRVTLQSGRWLLGCCTLVAGRALVDLLFERDGCEIVVKLSLLFVAYLLLKLLLVEYGLLSLLVGFLNARLHPVGIVTSRLDVQVVKLLLDILPDLTILQERI